MARSRNIKPGFYKNEDLAECSVWARFIFPGLWMLADREGRLEDRPKRIKGELLPFDSQDVEPLLCELEGRGFIIRYQNSDGRFIQISKFSAHQAPHYSEKPSTIKPPSLPEYSGDDEATKPENSGKDDAIKRGSQPPDSLIPDSLIPSTPTSPVGEVSPPAGKQKKKSEDITFNAWLERIKAAGERAVSDYQPVFDYAEKVGIPVEWIEMAWLKFRERYSTDPKASKKRYADWRRVFLNAVSDNWLGLWWLRDGQAGLTTAGEQAKLAQRAAA